MKRPQALAIIRAINGNDGMGNIRPLTLAEQEARVVDALLAAFPEPDSSQAARPSVDRRGEGGPCPGGATDNAAPEATSEVSVPEWVPPEWCA